MAKLKIDMSSGILEIEGSDSIVKDIYDDFKDRLFNNDNSFTRIETDTDSTTETSTTDTQSKKPESRSNKLKHEQNNEKDKNISDHKFNSSKIVNQLKARDDFKNISDSILQKSSLWKKIMLILTSSDTALSSGEITKVLNDFGVKTQISSVSRCLGNNDSELIRSAPRKIGSGSNPTYKLSLPAEQKFKVFVDKL